MEFATDSASQWEYKNIQSDKQIEWNQRQQQPQQQQQQQVSHWKYLHFLTR